MKQRAPLDTDGGRSTSNADLQVAWRVVDRAEVVAILSPLLDAELGRHRTISVRGLLVACQLNALARHHHGHLVEVARTINALTDDQRALIGIVKHDPAQTYDRVDRLFNKLCAVLDAGHVADGCAWTPNGWRTGWWPLRCRRSSAPRDRWPLTAPTSRRGGRCTATR
jgi:hypothetical protein